MTTLVILENDALAQQRLEAALHRVVPDAVIAGMLPSICVASQWFAENQAPDLVFADVQLSDGMSFELFEQTPLVCPVVFCTAGDEYVEQAMAAGPAPPDHVIVSQENAAKFRAWLCG